MRQWRKNCRLWKKDLRCFFRQLPLCPRKYSLIGYRWRNLLYFDKSVPMGLRSATYMAQRTTDCIVFMHKQFGYFSINYIDDYRSAELAENAWSSYNLMGKIMTSVGAEEAKDKAVPPTTRLEFLGNTVDTVKMTLEVSDERKQELLLILKQWSNKKQYSKKQLQSLIGKLSFVTNCVRPGRIFISRLIEQLKNAKTSGNVIQTEMRKDLQWWSDFLPKFDGICIMWLEDWRAVDKTLVSDASLVGGGAVLHGHKQFFHVRFPQWLINTTEHIAQREIFVIMVLVRLWANQLCGKVVRFSTDSETSMHIINRGRTNDPFMLQCIREMAWITTKFEILLKVHHVAGRNNTLPDALSRWYQSAEARRTFKRLTDKNWKRRSVTEQLMQFHYFW